MVELLPSQMTTVRTRTLVCAVDHLEIPPAVAPAEQVRAASGLQVILPVRRLP